MADYLCTDFKLIFKNGDGKSLNSAVYTVVPEGICLLVK